MRVRVARIGKPFGTAGEVTVQGFTDEPESRFAPGTVLFAGDADDAAGLVVRSARGLGERWTLGFEGVGNRDAAESLRGTILHAEIDPEERPEDDEEWFDHQLVGLPARDPAGAPMGKVIGVDHPPAHELLVIRTPSGHVARVPFVRAIVPEVDAEGVVIDAPPGLLDEPDSEEPAGGEPGA